MNTKDSSEIKGVRAINLSEGYVTFYGNGLKAQILPWYIALYYSATIPTHINRGYRGFRIFISKIVITLPIPGMSRYTIPLDSLLVAITNETCVKSSMEYQDYKVVSTHAHEISGWTILSIIIHSRDSHLGGTNGDVQYDISTPAFNNGEQLEYFHGRILRLQQEIMLSGEIVSPSRLLYQ